MTNTIITFGLNTFAIGRIPYIGKTKAKEAKMSLFEKKRKPCKVIVHFDNLAVGKYQPRHMFEREIIVPDGYTFKEGFVQHPRMLNRDGRVAWIYDWKAGYQIIYEYIYD